MANSPLIHDNDYNVCDMHLFLRANEHLTDQEFAKKFGRSRIDIGPCGEAPLSTERLKQMDFLDQKPVSVPEVHKGITPGQDRLGVSCGAHTNVRREVAAQPIITAGAQRPMRNEETFKGSRFLQERIAKRQNRFAQWLSKAPTRFTIRKQQSNVKTFDDDDSILTSWDAPAPLWEGDIDKTQHSLSGYEPGTEDELDFEIGY